MPHATDSALNCAADAADAAAGWSVADSAGAGDTSHAITNLTNGLAYYVQVRAVVTADLKSDWAIGSDTYTPLDEPDAPTDITVEPGNTQLTVEWTAPTDDGGRIDDYEVRHCTVDTTADPAENCAASAGDEEDGWSAAASAGADTSHEITNLTNGLAYYVQVRAVNDAGSSNWAIGSGTSTPLALPGAPTITEVEPGNTQLTVMWTAPVDDGGGITDYEVRHCTPHATDSALNCAADAADGTETDPALNPGNWSAVVSADADTSHEITNLTNGLAYYVQVRAVVTADLKSDWAIGSDTYTPLALPGAPTITEVEAGDEQLTVEWTAPVDDGGRIDDYEVRHCTVDTTG